MTQVRHLVDPKPVRTKLKDAAVGFLLDQRQRQRVTIKRDGLIISVSRAFDRDVGTAGKLWSIEFRHHDVDLGSPSARVKDAQRSFARPSSLSWWRNSMDHSFPAVPTSR